MIFSILRRDWLDNRLLDILLKAIISFLMNVCVYIVAGLLFLIQTQTLVAQNFLNLYLPIMQITMGLTLCLNIFVVAKTKKWEEIVFAGNKTRITLAALILSLGYGFVAITPLGLSLFLIDETKRLIDLRFLDLAVVLSAPMQIAGLLILRPQKGSQKLFSLLLFVVLTVLLWALFSILGWLSFLCAPAFLFLFGFCIKIGLEELTISE